MNLQRILTSLSIISLLSFGIACSQSDSETRTVETQASTAD
ncbi:MAG: hypothetical protein O3A00_10380 [Planctomycetota bacterium]|nr:hypothetical protein [Planctomycetota bacterium]